MALPHSAVDTPAICDCCISRSDLKRERGKRELIALLNLSSWCLVMVKRLFLAVQRGCLQFVIVVFSDHSHLLFLLTFLCCFFLTIIRLFDIETFNPT